jgi:hypothetical protein
MSASQLIEAKNKAVSAILKDESGRLSPEFINKIDNVFSTENGEPALSEVTLQKFNNKFSKSTGAIYNPFATSQKYVGGCVECRTFADYIVQACNNFGCVAENFTRMTESNNCNSLVVEKYQAIQTGVLANDVFDLTTSNVQLASTNPINSCLNIILARLNTAIDVKLEALCSCTGIDAMGYAMEYIMNKLKYSYDIGILYGDVTKPAVTTGTGANANTIYPAIPTIDSIDRLIPVTQKTTASDTSDLYKKIVTAIAKITARTGCDRSKIKVLTSSAIATLMLGATDNNDRPYASELTKGDTCTIQIACSDVITCQSIPVEVLPNGKIKTDVWVGIPDYYTFVKYMYPEIGQFNNHSNFDIKIPMIMFAGGKLQEVGAFEKITATI